MYLQKTQFIYILSLEVFTKWLKMAIMIISESEALIHENKKIQQQNGSSVSIEPETLGIWI